MYIEGRNAVIEILKTDLPLENILIARGLKPDKSLDYLKKLAGQRHITLQEVARGELDELSEHGAHQGVIAQAASFPYTELDEVLAKVADQQNALVIVLDHITDPGNLGAIARSAEVVGAACVVIPDRRSVKITSAAWKAAAGALAHLPVVRVTNVAQTIERLKDAGFWIAGATEYAESSAWDSSLSGRIALVMGSEGEGLSRLIKERCDFLVNLPVVGEVGSLNVAQACTVLAYEWLRQCTT
jgi:23S rRNA (guanosine2251-2'-O)-methyltransferase